MDYETENTLESQEIKQDTKLRYERFHSELSKRIRYRDEDIETFFAILDSPHGGIETWDQRLTEVFVRVDNRELTSCATTLNNIEIIKEVYHGIDE